MNGSLPTTSRACSLRPTVEAGDGLQLLTVHKAKGLEFDTVILPGLGRRTRSDDQRLLMWLEYIRDGELRLLLAPIHKVGGDKDPVYDYLRKVHATKSGQESTRLLYVAATRARRLLHLLGHTRLNQDGTAFKAPDPRALLSKIWGAVEADFVEAFRGVDGEDARFPKDAELAGIPLRRLSLDWTAPAPPEDIAWNAASPAGFARQFEMPWLSDDPNQRARTMSLDELIAVGQAIPPGVTARSNTSMFVPPRIPDLIGVRERRYLDNTGLVRHESIGDLMRYSSLVQDMGGLSRYGDSQPPRTVASRRRRYSDEQLYALALYLYSLQPPPNPTRFGALAARGEEIFERERCARCHEPPLYTNNKLVAADGFEPPPGHKQRFDVMEERVGTDPRYTDQRRIEFPQRQLEIPTQGIDKKEL